jgi:hypothetical protein
MNGEWYWISLPYATFGVAVENGKVVRTAPIASWARGKEWLLVESWYRRKGAVIRRG